MGRLSRFVLRARARASKAFSPLRQPVWAVITRDEIQICGVRHSEAFQLAQQSGGIVVTNTAATRMVS